MSSHPRLSALLPALFPQLAGQSFCFNSGAGGRGIYNVDGQTGFCGSGLQ